MFTTRINFKLVRKFMILLGTLFILLGRLDTSVFENKKRTVYFMS